MHDGNELPSLPTAKFDEIPQTADNMVEHSTKSQPVHQSTHTRPLRMKFKSCGIRCNNYASLKQDAMERHEDFIADDTVLDVTIIGVPNTSRDVHDYKICQEINDPLPVLFSLNGFCITFFKGDITAMEKLKDGRVNYDLQHPERNGVEPHKIRPQTPS